MINFWEPNVLPIVEHKRNLISHWLGTDSIENFKKHPKVGYTETSVLYKYNSNGFRTHEFDASSDRPSILCLGCSFTEAVGINYNDSWVAHIENYFPEHNVYNLGIGGSSGDAVPRLLNNVGGLLNTKIVFILWTELFRYELYKEGNVDTIFPNLGRGYNPIMLTDPNFYNIRQRNRALVTALSKQHNYKVVEFSIDDYSGPADNGRDDHPGPIWHKHMANIFIEKYNDNSTI